MKSRSTKVAVVAGLTLCAAALVAVGGVAFREKHATAPDVALHDKSAVAPDGKDIELVITDGRVTGGSVPDGVYRLSDGRLVMIRSNWIAATANR